MPTSMLPMMRAFLADIPVGSASGDFMRVVLSPGAEASNGNPLPVMVVGHEQMSPAQWIAFVSKYSAQMWSQTEADRQVRSGFDLLQMLPTTLFGQALKEGGHGCFPRVAARYGELALAVGKWPDAVEALQRDFAGQPVVLSDLIRAIRMLPDPTLPSASAYRTLGDMLEPGLNVKALGY